MIYQNKIKYDKNKIIKRVNFFGLKFSNEEKEKLFYMIFFERKELQDYTNTKL